MFNATRIRRLFLKDLLDILRDRRTLAAMVVVPIVLYPLLMLGSLQAATLQTDQMKAERLVIAVQTESVRQWLQKVLASDHERVKAREKQAKARGERFAEIEPLKDPQIVVLNQPDLTDWVRENGHCAVMFDPQDLPVREGTWKKKALRPQVIGDSAEIRSSVAVRRLSDALERHRDFLVQQQALMSRWEEGHIHPLVVREIDVASAQKRGGSLLGQIIPLILILMTITGAIYPAIDLTAGERERGTLETLMVCPIPVVEIIAGKFLVILSVSLIGAALNLCSMGMTVHFGGISSVLASAGETEIPMSVLPLILLCLIPLAVLFSAVLLAVCSFARSFKEAQNYVTPVILAALVPAGVAALPGTELEGVMKILPVANMVLLTRELLLGNADVGTIVIVMLSTCLYAVTAVALAVKIFGQEAVLFADTGSWRAQFDRSAVIPSALPRPTLALMYVSLLYPIWFYLQTGLQGRFNDFATTLMLIQIMMVLLFVVMPVLMVVYYKIDVRKTFNLRWCKPRYLLVAVLLGLSTWALSYELIIFQKTFSLFGITDRWLEKIKPFRNELLELSPAMALLLGALIPSVCEEMLFRGMLLSGLRHVLSKWGALVAVGTIFAVYHYAIQRFVITLLLGILLAYVCWHARSIVPVIIIHLMHNGIQLILAMPSFSEEVNRALGSAAEPSNEHLPAGVLVPAVFMVVTALILCLKRDKSYDEKDTLSAVPAMGVSRGT